MRGDFLLMLYESNKSRVKYLFGTSIENIRENEGAVEVKFVNGTTDVFDLVVGADGQWSRTRRMMLGPDAADALRLIPSTYVAYFTMNKPLQAKEEYIATMYLSPGRKGIMTRRHSPEEIQVYLSCKTESKQLANGRRGDVKAEKEALTETFQGAGWQTEEILRSLEGAADFYCERLGLVKLSTWSKGRVVLLGDAAYCPSANTGMGTTSSIVGAYILAGEISKHCQSSVDGPEISRPVATSDVQLALEAYEKQFRPFMDQVQKGVLEDKGFMPATSFGVATFNFIVGMASLFRLDIARWVMKENIRDWSLPDYEEMINRVQGD